MRAALIAGVLLIGGAFASAAVALPACRFDGGRLAFGDNDPLAARGHLAATAIGEAILRCDGGGEIEIEILLHVDPDSGFADTGHGLAFVLFQDPARRLRWGDGGAAGQPIRRRVVADGHAVAVPVYGVLKATGAGKPGQYVARLRVEVRSRDTWR